MTKEYIQEKVIKYYNENAKHYIFFNPTLTDKEHIINIATSILMHKYEVVGYKPGSFIRAFLDNNLIQTFNKADRVNVKCIHFYMMLVYNIEL